MAIDYVIRMKIRSINPATEQLNGEFETLDWPGVKKAVKDSREAFEEWRRLDVSERAGYLRKLASALRSNAQDYGRCMTIEMGKPIKSSIGEVEKCAWAADVYADSAKRWLEDEQVEAGARKSFITPQPLGVILSIMPWNFPFWQALRFGIPALAAGNTSILRHSNTVPMCAMKIGDAFTKAGFPDGVFEVTITDHDAVARLIRGNLVDGVSLTGSVEAGRRVAALAGRHIKKFVLELGGSDPFIVLGDAKLESVCPMAVEARLINSGQSCIAAKRFIVVKDIAEEFSRRFVELMQAKAVGDPMDTKTEVGPMASRQQVETLESQVGRSVAMGAKVECGGHRMPGKGYFFEPTVVTHVRPGMPVLNEELFGPVAPIIAVKDEADAVRIANRSRLGLGASVWTSDTAKGEELARKIEAGVVYVNGIVASDPRLPFGGVKDSGIGRELSRYGLLEFTNIKTVVVK